MRQNPRHTPQVRIRARSVAGTSRTLGQVLKSIVQLMQTHLNGAHDEVNYVALAVSWADRMYSGLS